MQRPPPTPCQATGTGRPGRDTHALDGQLLLAVPSAARTDLRLDFQNKELTVEFLDDFVQPAAGLWTLTDGAVIRVRNAGTATFDGQVEVPIGSSADLFAGAALIGPTGVVTIEPLASLSIHGSATNNGSLTILGGAIDAQGGLTNGAGGMIFGFGNFLGDVTNENEAVFVADTQAINNYTNTGTTIVQSGTLTIIGDLFNSGTIIGDVVDIPPFSQPISAEQGLAVLGNYTASQAASLLMPNPDLVVKVGRDFDVAISDNLNYDMGQAELRMIGLGGQVQSMETMSADVGADRAGFDRALPGSFPLGTLRIGPTSTIVSLVDNHDNDGLGQVVCEAVYARNLVVEAGAVLNTNGCPVYYNALVLNGVVDDPTNLIRVNFPDIDDEIRVRHQQRRCL